MEKTCAYVGCDSQKVIARGLCAKHYAASRRNGEVPGQAPCTVKSCKSKAYARGLCNLHYVRERSGYGDHWCLDCNARIPARTTGGNYPDRCPPCQKQRNRETLLQRRAQAAVAPFVRCGRCKRDLARECFYDSQRHTGGWCIECQKEYSRREFDRTPRPCEWCGVEFEPVHPSQLFCSKSHKGAAHKSRSKGVDKRGRVCNACGADLALTRRSGTLYCNPACRERMRRADGRVTDETRRGGRVRKKYGLTLEQYDALIAVAVVNGCAICMTRDPGVKGWALDHCHKNGRIRGVLCGRCNMGLGLFKDDVACLTAAIKYLG